MLWHFHIYISSLYIIYNGFGHNHPIILSDFLVMYSFSLHKWVLSTFMSFLWPLSLFRVIYMTTDNLPVSTPLKKMCPSLLSSVTDLKFRERPGLWIFFLCMMVFWGCQQLFRAHNYGESKKTEIMSSKHNWRKKVILAYYTRGMESTVMSTAWWQGQEAERTYFTLTQE